MENCQLIITTVQIKKIRRRIEDYLRKAAPEVILKIAKLLNIKED